MRSRKSLGIQVLVLALILSTSSNSGKSFLFLVFSFLTYRMRKQATASTSLLQAETLSSFFKKTYFTEVQLIYNVVLISAVQRSDSVIHIYIVFHILFHYGLSQDIEHSSLCYTVGPCYNSLHLLIPDFQSILPSLLGNHKSVLYVCESVSLKTHLLKKPFKTNIFILSYQTGYLVKLLFIIAIARA